MLLSQRIIKPPAVTVLAIHEGAKVPKPMEILLMVRLEGSHTSHPFRKEPFIPNLFTFSELQHSQRLTCRSFYGWIRLFAYLMKIDKITHQGAYCFCARALTNQNLDIDSRLIN